MEPISQQEYIPETKDTAKIECIFYENGKKFTFVVFFSKFYLRILAILFAIIWEIRLKIKPNFEDNAISRQV